MTEGDLVVWEPYPAHYWKLGNYLKVGAGYAGAIYMGPICPSTRPLFEVQVHLTVSTRQLTPLHPLELLAGQSDE